ncbi:MAG: cupin domain-containing protein, partial [Dehalococcoidia bacterium]
MATKTQEWQEPTGQSEKSGLGKWKRPRSPYDMYMEEQGIPIFRDIGVERVQDLPLKPWKRLGGKGTFIQLYGTEGKWGMYVVEVPAAGALNPEKHMYEEIYLVVDGRGTTEVWRDGSNKKNTFEWSKGSLFSIPMNATHRIINATNSPALLLSGTTAPPVMNLFQSTNFVFNTDYSFEDRYDEGAD